MTPKSKKLWMKLKRKRTKMTYIHLIKGTTPTGEEIEEFFFSEQLAEWEAAALGVAGRPHEKVQMTIEEAIEKYGIYFKISWMDQGTYHEEVWKEFSRAEERHGDLLLALPVHWDPLRASDEAAEIQPLGPTQVDRTSVRDLH